jgi:hypothetical protein
MSVRGTRPRANSRRPLASPLDSVSTPELIVGRPNDRGPQADAEALIAADGDRAYREARDRQARAREAAAYWDRVARLIARRPDQLSAHARDAGTARLSATPAESTQVEELERILEARPGRFRLQFLAVATERGPSILSEFEVKAGDASDAVRAAAVAEWPARAIGMRLIDRDGREIYERLKADNP